MTPDEMRAYLADNPEFAAKVRARARELAATLAADGPVVRSEPLVASEGTKGPRKLGRAHRLAWWLKPGAHRAGRMG